MSQHRRQGAGFVFVAVLLTLLSMTLLVTASMSSIVESKVNVVRQEQVLIAQQTLNQLISLSQEQMTHPDMLLSLTSLDSQSRFLSNTGKFDYDQIVSCDLNTIIASAAVSTNSASNQSANASSTSISRAESPQQAQQTWQPLSLNPQTIQLNDKQPQLQFYSRYALMKGSTELEDAGAGTVGSSFLTEGKLPVSEASVSRVYSVVMQHCVLLELQSTWLSHSEVYELEHKVSGDGVEQISEENIRKVYLSFTRQLVAFKDLVQSVRVHSQQIDSTQTYSPLFYSVQFHTSRLQKTVNLATKVI